MLPLALLAGVEAGLNRVLALDATAGPRLAALEGRVIAVDCSAPALRLYLLPGSDGKYQSQVRLPEIGKARVYRLTSRILSI